MNIPNALQPLPATHAAPIVSYSPAASTHQTDMQASVFKPVSQVAHAEKQTVTLKPGTVPSPLHNAVQAYGFEPDVAASLVTYGANGKLMASGSAVHPEGALKSNQATALMTGDDGAGSYHVLGSDVGPDVGPDIAVQSNSNARDDKPIAHDGELSDEANTAQTPETEKQKAQHIKEQDQEEVRVLAARDREVRTHEQAHAAVGGAYAGAPKYQFEQGPDGVNYAVGGEVPIDVGAAATPEQSLEKAQTVRRAAMAPSEPSPQDRQVAQEATQLEAQARQQIAAARAQERAAKNESASPNDSAGNGASSSDGLQAKEVTATDPSPGPLTSGAHAANIGSSSVEDPMAISSATTIISSSTSASSSERAQGDLVSRIAQVYRAASEPVETYLRASA